MNSGEERVAACKICFKSSGTAKPNWDMPYTRPSPLAAPNAKRGFIWVQAGATTPSSTTSTTSSTT